VNKFDEQQIHTLIEAKKLAQAGEEFSHLCKILDPEMCARLRIYVQSLPNEIARKTIYGRAVTNAEAQKEKRVPKVRVRGDKGR